MALAMNAKHHQRVKHFDGRAHFLREAIEQLLVRVEYCPTGDMLADVLTKALPPLSHENFPRLMGLVNLGSLDNVLAALI